MLDNWIVLANAGIPVSWLVTHEEARAESAIAATAHANPSADGTAGMCVIWSLTSGDGGNPGWQLPAGWKGEDIPQGLRPPQPSDEAKEHRSLLHALDWIEDNKGASVCMIYRDAHTHLRSDFFRRAIKDATRRLRGTRGRLVLLSCESHLPDDIKADVPIIEPGLPDRELLRRLVRDSFHAIHSANSAVKLDDVEACADALRGLGAREAKDAILIDLARSERGSVSAERLAAHKAKELAKVDGVQFVSKAESMSDVGGLDVLQATAEDYRDAFSQEARDFGCDAPKGIMLVGVPGCGKSLSCRAISSAVGLPLVMLDPSACEGSLVGETYSKIMAALRVVDALAPCVLAIDEIEKALGSGGEMDSGSKDQLRRALLIWLQDRTSEVLVLATANDVSALPPELKRLGRWDYSFFVDLPTPTERAAILRVHLRKRKRTLTDDEVADLAAKSKGYTGAELEVAVSRAVRRCFKQDRRELTAKDVADQLKLITPQSNTPQIEALKTWANETGALLASTKEPKRGKGKRRQARRPKAEVDAPDLTAPMVREAPEA
jgi:hypothetical protein